MTKRIQHKWTKAEEKILIDNYSELGPTTIHKKFLPQKSVSSIKIKAFKLGLKVKKGFCYGHNLNIEDVSYFTEVKTAFAAYFLGFLWADGTVSKTTSNIRFKIVENDFNVIKDKIFKILKSWRYRVEHDGFDNHQKQSVLELNNKEFHRFLVENDYLIKSGASANKILAKIPNKYKHYWWRGYFDGDGSFVFDGKTVRVNIVSCYEQNWDFAEFLEKALNIGYRVGYNINDERKSSGINMEGEISATKFMDYILMGQKFGLKRKYDKYHDYLEYKKNVRPDKTSKYRGVSRSKSNGLWVTQIYKGKCFRFTFGKTKKDEILAAKKYDEMAKQLFGNKAYINFSNE